jgi:energy-coupling factor transporter ATP-binding protein EcfA2
MGRVTFFEIHGLAGRRKVVKHDLGPDVNVFWGANGSGKTSMLKILHSALLDDPTILLRVPFTRARVGLVGDAKPEQEYIRSFTKTDLYEGVSQLATEMDDDDAERYIRNLRAHRSSDDELPKWVTEPEPKPGSSFSALLRHGYLPISRVSEARRRRSPRTRPVTELIDEASFDRLFAEQIRDLWSDYNQRALLQIRNAQERGLARILGSVLETRGRPEPRRPAVENAEEAYEIVRNFFADQRLGAMLRLSREAFIQNYDSSTLVQEVVGEVADVQKGIDRAQEPQHRIEALLGRLYGGRKKVELRGNEVVVLIGKESIPLQSLSSGEKQLLQLLLECLAAGTNPVLIDEPELSLHVDWQNQLVSCMRTVNEGAQLIMATHAPEVMANLRDSDIYEL